MDEINIEKIEDVISEYSALFRQYPRTRQDRNLIETYIILSLLVRDIRFGTARCTQAELDEYLKKARAERIQAEVFL